MNLLLQKLQPYPFEKLRALFKGVTPRADLAPISFGIGEPKHATPALIREAVVNAMSGLASYPATAGSEPLRQAIADWTKQRCPPSTRPRKSCPSPARAKPCSRWRKP